MLSNFNLKLISSVFLHWQKTKMTQTCIMTHEQRTIDKQTLLPNYQSIVTFQVNSYKRRTKKTKATNHTN